MEATMDSIFKKVVYKYVLKFVSLNLIFCALSAVYFILLDVSVWSVLIYIVPCLCFRRFIIKFRNKKLLSPLYYECYSQKYYDIVNLMPLPLDIWFRERAEEYMGNYDKVIALESAHYEASKSIKEKCTILNDLARIYFNLRDREKLAKTIEKFNQLKKNNPKKWQVFAVYEAFDYFQNYLDGEFERCIAASEENIKKYDLRMSPSTFFKMRFKFNIAVMCYESGKTERARELFTNIIETVPNYLNNKILSEKYLSAIETGNSDILAPVIIEPDSASYNQARKYLTVNKLKFILTAFIMLVFLIVMMYCCHVLHGYIF